MSDRAARAATRSWIADAGRCRPKGDSGSATDPFRAVPIRRRETAPRGRGGRAIGHLMLVVADVDGAAAVEHDELVAVGLLEAGGREYLGGRAVGELALVQAQHAVEALRLRDVVGGDEQTAALVGELGEDGLDAGGAGRVDPGQRLVEQ